MREDKKKAVALRYKKGEDTAPKVIAKGIGEIAAITGAPAIQLAYYNRDGIFRTSLPPEHTPYSRKKYLLIICLFSHKRERPIAAPVFLS